MNDSSIIGRSNYLTSQKYISGMIKEYDISKANISILYSGGLITESLYNKLYNMDKMKREVYIGNMMKTNPEYKTGLKNGLKHYKSLFYESNGMNDDNIVAIHNDSLFILNKTPGNTIFDYVEFKYKGSYIAFYNIFDLEIYYYFDTVTEDESLVVKGINDKVIVKHEDGFADFLKALFFEREYNGTESALRMIHTFSSQYLNNELEPEYYREFNSNSKFKIGSCYYTDYLLKSQIKDVDKFYNYRFLCELHSIYATQYL